MTSARRRAMHSAGFGLIELLVTAALLAAMLGIAVSNLRDFTNPLLDGTAQVNSFFKQVRAEAIASTSAYTVEPASATSIRTKRGRNCTDATATVDPRVKLTLPDGASLAATDWHFCFSARGLPDANVEIDLHDTGGATKTIEILLGGAIRVL